ncbi:MAG: biopolymer transporter ExbD, partial [Ectothiorhodospiraceae bacterium]|jgi:biopolymer transport protein ExbD
MRLPRPDLRRRKIGLTPLVDVVFILLFFFMLTSSLVQWRAIGLSVTAPSASAGSLEGSALVRIHDGGNLDLNGVPVSLRQLESRVRGLAPAERALRLVVQPDPEVPLQNIVDVLDRLRAAGTANISLRGQ